MTRKKLPRDRNADLPFLITGLAFTAAAFFLSTVLDALGISA